MEDNISLIVIGLVVLITVFLIFRFFFLWYFKINERVNDLEKIKLYLWFIAKSQNPMEFERFEEEMNDNSSYKTPLQQDMERIKNIYKVK